MQAAQHASLSDKNPINCLTGGDESSNSTPLGTNCPSCCAPILSLARSP